MSAILRFLSRVIGVVLLAAAFLQWVTFDYPDVNPFRPGAIFAPGMLSQVLNWLLVCVLGTIGWGFLTLWKFRLGSGPTKD
jgi:heme A synthase